MKKNIQEQFGENVIGSFVNFCRADIAETSELQEGLFGHIEDADLRRYLAQTYYGARWLYKIGLGLLVDGDEAIAHVRTQVIDYGSICEAVLADSILFGKKNNLFKHKKHVTKDCGPASQKNMINWDKIIKSGSLQKMNFWWIIEVSEDEGIIDGKHKAVLNKLRALRNTVHVTELASRREAYFRTLAKNSFKTANETIDATKRYKETFIKHDA